MESVRKELRGLASHLFARVDRLADQPSATEADFAAMELDAAAAMLRRIGRDLRVAEDHAFATLGPLEAQVRMIRRLTAVATDGLEGAR